MSAMTNDAGKKRLMVTAVVLVALALPAALAVYGGLKMWQEHRQAQAPGSVVSEQLREAAERAADAVMPAPTLGADAVIVECDPREIEAQVQRVVRLAGGVGGSSSAWNDGSSVRIVAKVPSSSESLFRDLVARHVYDIAISGNEHASAVVEVLVRPKQAPAAQNQGRRVRQPGSGGGKH